MAHLKDKRSRFDKTPAEWLVFGSQVGELTNTWAIRDDIVAFVGEGAGKDVGAAAAFSPTTAEIELDVNAAFGEGIVPSLVPDIRVRDHQFEYPAVSGAILHEAMHARHTRWDLRDMHKTVKDRFEAQLVILFEETRIESRGVQHFPKNKGFLRACAIKLSIGELPDDFASNGHQAAANLILITLARVDAGVLKRKDVRKVNQEFTKFYGQDVMDKFRDIWRRGQAYRGDTDWGPLHELAKEWVKVLEDEGHDPKSEGEMPQELKDLIEKMIGEAMANGEMPDGEGEGSGAGGMLGEMEIEIEVTAGSDAIEQSGAERDAEKAKRMSESTKERDDHKDQTKQVFGRGTGPGPAQTSSTLQRKRQPTGPERAAAVKLASDLEKARYRDRIVTKRTSQLPSGRLRSQGAVAAAAQRSRGMQVTAEPWSTKRRRHVEDPNLKVGIMVDISGSMSMAMEGMGVASWMLSEAIRRVQGQAATIYYGNSPWVGMAPGQHLREVEIYTAADGTERFDQAFKALNGKLDLLYSNGARVLFVISDLHYTSNEREAAKKWFARCRASGIAVVVAQPPRNSYFRENDGAADIVLDNAEVVYPDWSDPTVIGKLIGAAAVKQLAKTSRRD